MALSPEGHFIAWLQTDSQARKTLLHRLPREVLTPEGWQSLHQMPPSVSVRPQEARLSREQGIAFLRSQLLSCVARSALRSQRNGGDDQLRQIFQLFEECKNGIEPLPIVAFEDRAPATREVIPTGIDALDEQIQGLARGDLGILGLPSGFGKTCILANFAVSALFDARNVLYITVADQGFDELAPRIATCILETPCPPDASDLLLAQRHYDALKKVAGTLWIADFTDRTCTLDDITQAIRAQPCDLVIVDHADDIQSTWNDPTATRHGLRAIYLALKRMATDMQVPIWTGSQTHDRDWGFGYSGIQGLAEAKVGKASGAAVVLVGTGGPDPDPGIILCHIAKARRTYRERTIPVHIDFSICRVW